MEYMKIIVYLGIDINGFFNDYAFIDAENNNMFKAKDNETGVWFGAYPNIAADNFEIGEWNDGPLEGEDTWQHVLNGSLDGTSAMSGDVEGALEFYLGDIEQGGSRNLTIYYSLEMKENLPPVASFTCTPESPVVNETIVFNASRSYDPGGIITKYEWDFGDGNSTNTTKRNNKSFLFLSR
jgi:PKD repeat protein